MLEIGKYRIVRVGVCLVAVAVVVRILAAQDWNPGVDLLAGERGERRKGERRVIRGGEGGRPCQSCPVCT